MSRRLTVRGVVLSAIFSALTILLNFLQVHPGFSAVPITLGNLGVMLAGALLGGTYGFLSMFWMILLTAIGLPFMAGSGGMAALLSYSGGYVWAWPFCALFTGMWASRVRGPWLWQGIQVFLAAEVFGSWLCYLTGVPWMQHVYHLSTAKAWALGCWPFLPGDTMKAVLTALIVVPVRKVYPVARLVGHQSSVVNLETTP